MTNRRRALTQLENLSKRLEPEVRKQFLKALAHAQREADLDAALTALEHGKVELAFEALTRGLPGAMAVVRGALATAFHISGTIWMKTEVPSALRVAFSLGLPQAAERMRLMDLSLLPILRSDMEAGLRAVLINGLKQGKNPLALLKQAREFVGLTEYDARIIASFEQQLRSDPARALSRLLRDKRHDGPLRKAAAGEAELTERAITEAVRDYQSKLLTWRTETWSRTATLRAARESNLASWQQVAVDGPVEQERYVKTWMTTLDGKERPEHHRAHGTTVPLDSPFPVNGGQMTPGDNEYNCRCTFTVRILPADAERRNAFLTSAARTPLGDQEDRDALLGA